MIHRKALWLTGLIILTMIAADIWRLTLLSDWRHLPVGGPGDSHTTNGLTLFTAPLAVFVIAGIQLGRKYLVRGPADAVPPWQRFHTRILVSVALVMAALHAILIARTLGYTQSWDPLTIPRLSAVIMGLLVASIGNGTPKLPWLAMRPPLFQLDPWQWHRHARFIGRVRVGTGFAIILGSPLLPPQIFNPFLFALALAAMTAMIGYRLKLRREPAGPIFDVVYDDDVLVMSDDRG